MKLWSPHHRHSTSVEDSTSCWGLPTQPLIRMCGRSFPGRQTAQGKNKTMRCLHVLRAAEHPWLNRAEGEAEVCPAAPSFSKEQHHLPAHASWPCLALRKATPTHTYRKPSAFPFSRLIHKSIHSILLAGPFHTQHLTPLFGLSGEWPHSPALAHEDSLPQPQVSHSTLFSIPTPLPPAHIGTLVRDAVTHMF